MMCKILLAPWCLQNAPTCRAKVWEVSDRTCAHAQLPNTTFFTEIKEQGPKTIFFNFKPSGENTPVHSGIHFIAQVQFLLLIS